MREQRGVNFLALVSVERFAVERERRSQIAHLAVVKLGVAPGGRVARGVAAALVVPVPVERDPFCRC